MKTSVIALSSQGRRLARRIEAGLDGCMFVEHDGPVAAAIHGIWGISQGIICVMATGIVVRALAPLMEDKTKDPCVVVVDPKGRFAISLLSGHLGGGNVLAEKVAAITGGQAVITTASDVVGVTALDLWARRNGLSVGDRQRFTQATMHLVDNGKIVLYGPECSSVVPPDFRLTKNPQEADLVISWRQQEEVVGLHCIPRCLYVGMGCNRGTSCDDIAHAFEEMCERHRIAPAAIAGLATIDVKHDEPGMAEFAGMLGLDLKFYSRELLNSVTEAGFSAAVHKAVGAKGVAEPAALLAAREGGRKANLVIPKIKWKDVTFAVAEQVREQWD